MNISDNIKRYRKEKGLTQKELAEKLDKSIRMIQKYESGEVEPSIEVLNEIANVLGTDFFEFLNSNDSKINMNWDEGTVKLTPKITIDNNLINELIYTLFENKEIGYVNILEGDLEFIAEHLKKNLIDVLNMVKEKNNYILQGYYYPDDFKQRLEKDPYMNR